MHDKTYSVDADVVYGDVLARIDLTTLRRIPWENNLPFFLVDFLDTLTNERLPMCPRGLLKNAVACMDQQFNLSAVAGVEFEFFNFQESPESLREKNFMNLKPLTPGMFGYSLLRPANASDFFESVFDQCHKFGIDIEGLHTETGFLIYTQLIQGPGVYEVALRYGDAVALSDSGQLFKTSVKQIGQLRYGVNGKVPIYPSFMAKPSASLPGCSGHVHLSLFKNGENAFYDPQDEHSMSTLMKQFTAGVLASLPAFTAIYAPTVNSYKRLVENYWAPVNVCWGLENRTAAIRVITPKSTGENACSPSGTRIELRVPGADMNTHLVLAAAFASGMYGIKSKLELCPPVKDEGRKSAERLPKSLGAAIEKMDKSPLSREILGAEFIQHYVKSRREEWEKWERAVTQYEVERYFELV